MEIYKVATMEEANHLCEQFRESRGEDILFTTSDENACHGVTGKTREGEEVLRVLWKLKEYRGGGGPNETPLVMTMVGTTEEMVRWLEGEGEENIREGVGEDCYAYISVRDPQKMEGRTLRYKALGEKGSGRQEMLNWRTKKIPNHFNTESSALLDSLWARKSW